MGGSSQAPRPPTPLLLLPGRPRWSAANPRKALNKEGSELLQPSSGLMQFPVGVALTDFANFAAGQAAKPLASKSPPYFHMPFVWYEAVIWVYVIRNIFSSRLRGGILALLWQNTKNDRKISEGE